MNAYLNWGSGVTASSEYTFTATDAGQHVFTPKFSYAGDQTATVTDKALAGRSVTTSVVTVTNTPASNYPHDSSPSGVELSDGSMLLAFLGQRGRLYVRRNVGTHDDPTWMAPVLVRIPASPGEIVGADSPSLVCLGSTIALFHTFTDGTYFQVWLTTSTDEGATWSTPTQITSESGHVQRVQALVDGTTLYLFWSRQDTNQKLFFQTTTDLSSWSSVAQVSQPIGVHVLKTTSNFAIVKLASGSWLLGWLAPSAVNESGAGNNLNYPTVHVATSANLSSWSSAVELNLPFSQRWPQSVALAQEPGTGTIYAAFEQYAYPYDTYLVARTSSTGTTWATQTVIGYDGSVPANGYQGYTAAMPTLISGSMYCSFTAEVGGGAAQGYGHGSWESASSGKGVVNCDLNGGGEPSFLPYGADPLFPSCPTTNCNESGYPINTLTGLQSTSATDLSFPAIGQPLVVSRAYNSEDGVTGRTGAFGIGWSWSYGARAVTLLDGSVRINDTNGRRLVFWKTGATWTADSYINATLTAGGGGGYVLTRHDRTVWTFDSSGALISIADRNGNTTTLAYSSGKVASITAAGGRSLTITTDGSGRITQIVGPGSLTASYTYDGNGHLLTATDPAGAVTTYTYDTRHQMLTVVDGNSHTVETNTYGSLGRVKEQRDANNELTTFTYGFQGYEGNYTVSVMTDPRGNQTRYYNDASWRLTQRDAYSGVTLVQRLRWTYDSNGNVTRFIDGLSTITDFTYDSRGNVLTATVDHTGGGLNLLSTFTYDSMNNLLTATDPLSHTWTYTYDGAGNLLEVENPLTETTDFGYDGAGQLTSVTDGVSRTTTFGYNGNGDLTTITQPGSVVTTLGYDSAGRLTSSTDPLSHVTSLTYNGRGQVTSVTNDLSETTSYGYDTLGNLTTITDALSEVTTYGYDNRNRLTSVTNALSNVTSYTYDANSNLTRVTDANSHQTNYAYDAINRVQTVADALSNTTTYTWDAANNITQVRDALNVTNRYVYDKAKRLTGVDLTNNSTLDITYAYDAASRRTSMVDVTGTTTYAYDIANRLTGVTAPTTGTVSYGYNAAGERTSLTYPSTNQVAYAYTNRGQLDIVTDWLSGVTDYDYDAAGRLTDITYPNGVTGTLAYDNANRLTDITYMDGMTTLEDISYTLNAVGIRTSMIDLSGTTDWTYDALYRLSDVEYPNSDDVNYGYDNVGNRTSLTINGATTTNTFDNADRMTASGSDSYSYNANGNLTSKTVSSVTTNYTYDTLNRLTSISGPTTASYVYDGANRRVSKTVNSVTTTYTWDRIGLGVVLDDGEEYIWGLGLIAQITSSGTDTYTHPDGLGNIRLLTDGSGAPIGDQAYDAFGATRSQSGVQLPFTYTGELVDAESGLVYLRARYVDPAQGRFQTKDPFPGSLDRPDSLHKYIYANNSPLYYTDPSGLYNPSDAWEDAKDAWGEVKGEANDLAGAAGDFAGDAADALAAVNWGEVAVITLEGLAIAFTIVGLYTAWGLGAAEPIVPILYGIATFLSLSSSMLACGIDAAVTGCVKIFTEEAVTLGMSEGEQLLFDLMMLCADAASSNLYGD